MGESGPAVLEVNRVAQVASGRSRSRFRVETDLNLKVHVPSTYLKGRALFICRLPPTSGPEGRCFSMRHALSGPPGRCCQLGGSRLGVTAPAIGASGRG